MITLIKEDPSYYKALRCYENCCFCGKPTPFWATRKHVACCEDCAKTHKTSELPTKKQWCEGTKKYPVAKDYWNNQEEGSLV